MWKLKHSKKDHVENYLFVGEEFVVGRKDASLLIEKDPSVSRRHAVLFVEHPEENLGDPSKKSSLFLRDEGSKYGTFHNGKRVTGQTQVFENDVIKFGQFESEYKVLQIPLVVTTSCLAVPAKRDLKRTVHKLGGYLVSEWQPSCSHLAMTEVKVTIKALCCLLSTKPIVKPEYFQDLRQSLKTSTFLLPNQYVPPIGEALIDKEEVSFDINPQRKVLFKNKTFFFIDEKQYKKLQMGIVLGGGTASILTSENLDPDKLLQDGCCVIDPMKESQSSIEVTDILPTVVSLLLKKNRRLIPESDIGLSVAYCSTEKFCNPNVNISEVLHTSKIQSQTLTQQVYVPDTEDKTTRTEKRQNARPSEACSSLHLSSFQIGTPVHEDIHVYDTPLSAQVKQELDDIFDEPMELNPEIPAKKEIVSPPSPVRPAKRQKTSDVQHKEEFPVPSPKADNEEAEEVKNIPRLSPEHNSRNHSPESRVRNSSPPPSVKTNGFSHITEELPRNLMKIEFVELVVRKTAPALQQYRNSSIKNFKKFKKVMPKHAQALPRIIGAHELAPFDKAAAEIFNNDVWDDAPEEAQEVSQPTKGEFDW
ncbi:hypothetical protein JTE90_028449 [Oedothorax gibbosus]|uniref:Nibrin n=1 Tax=Oedothorax gibbosus TaxID=931172 RepID=A0AAV6VH80_9ARAC|nr:hypothetical protein JTE90_028449 [Oedothorax gibbosus]